VTPPDTDPHSTTSGSLADGDDWFFHLSTCDLAENCSATLHVGPFLIDTTTPSAPGAVSSPSHGGGPASDPTVDLSWGAASDATSGVALYRYDLSTSATAPECASLGMTTAATSTTSSPLGDEIWYAHVCAEDAAGNHGPVVTGGPWVVDTTPPTAPADLASTSHTVGEMSNDQTVDVEWTPSSDDLSGVAGYAWMFNDQPVWSCDGDVDGTDPSATSSSLANGEWWFHVCAVDEAQNLSAVADLGPFVIDAGFIFADDFESGDLDAW